jgi:hypothetical protein
MVLALFVTKSKNKHVHFIADLVRWIYNEEGYDDVC